MTASRRSDRPSYVAGLWEADVPGEGRVGPFPAWAVRRAREAVALRADPSEASRPGSDAWWLARMRPVPVPVRLDPRPPTRCGWRPSLPLLDPA